ncbi:hypothetical protein [Hydrogenophaga sp. PAMC20947]|uniref:hypothetical protein n=1 Tax=Hydrogenophaga sp. PAMC20947 TaxID=2565558 RepID=UPI00109E0650|nr:hypothetical protein [Hydrogenophaga sp. PAMC20947]QCB47666.1 hypothetical protein E5678_17505 [Hydrogenophaga sp. PAMC20947]
MAISIQGLFITPAFAVARLGGSTTPMHAYDWVDTQNPRFDGETDIAPSWTLAVQPDGSVAPFPPQAIAFRDGDLIRPVAPFFEIWARLGEAGSDAGTWTEAPLTNELLASDGLSINSLRLSVTARNRKAARRSGDESHAFGNWQPLVIAGNDSTVKTIEGTSPPGTPVPMIPPGRPIPLGTVQMLRSTPQPPGRPWSAVVRVDTIRFRYTPARGSFYGPPEAASAQPALGRPAPAVPAANAYLNPQAGWRGAQTGNLVVPGDTYDAVDQNAPRGASLGVVDDTCEVHFDVSLNVSAGLSLAARAVAFVAPPDFAPNHRPFLSIADELNDRDGAAAKRNVDLTGAALSAWVEDLFERIYETVSLFNVDHFRSQRAAVLPSSKIEATDLDQGARPDPASAMGGHDALRSQVFQLEGATVNNPLPLSQHARMRHRALSDIQNLLALVAIDALAGRNRVREIVRAPFETEAFESADSSSMRMPPFMRQSNAMPLTLSAWQYDLLMRWVDEVQQQALAAPAGAGLAAVPSKAQALSPAAASRRSAVLSRIDAAELR